MPPLCNTRRRPSFELGFAPPICATCTIAPVSQAYTSDRIIARAATKFASSFTSHFTSLHFAWLQLCEPEEFISNSQMHQKADIRITLTWPQSLFVHKNKESQRSMTREETTDAWTFRPTLDHFPMESSCRKTQKAEKMTPVRILLRMQWSNWWNFGRK